MTASYRPSRRDRFRIRARRALLERLRSRVEPEGTRLLDLGGGTGATTVTFGTGARELVVLEPDARKVSRGRAAGAPVTFVPGVAEALPYGDGRFDPSRRQGAPPQPPGRNVAGRRPQSVRASLPRRPVRGPPVPRAPVRTSPCGSGAPAEVE